MTGRDVGSDVRLQFTSLQGRVVRSLALGGHRSRTTPLVVILPGLGLPFYTVPTARALVARGLDATVLDLPGFGSNLPRATRPTIHAAGMTAARWVETQTVGRPVVVLGHSTGGQAALTAALALSARRRDFSLVLAGTTFAPEQRRLHRLARATPFAYRDDRLDQLDPLEVYRGRTGIVAMLHSGLRDAPEERIAHLPVPVTVTAGVLDAFVPTHWLDQLARVGPRGADRADVPPRRLAQQPLHPPRRGRRPRPPRRRGRRSSLLNAETPGRRQARLWHVGPMPTYTSYDGTELAYRVEGSGEPLVVWPGGPARDAAYLGDLGGLARAADRSLVIPDPRGTGASPAPADPAAYAAVRPGDPLEVTGGDRDLQGGTVRGRGRRLCAPAAQRSRRMDLVHGLGRLDVPADRGIPPGSPAGSGQAAFCSMPPRGVERVQDVLPVSRDGL